jgi:Fic family protein
MRITGHYVETRTQSEPVRAFVPDRLPPADPPLIVEGQLVELHRSAIDAIGRLRVASTMVPSTDWYLYGFVRKEAVLTSQIEGTQATLRDVLTYEATQQTDRPDDVEEVCNYVEALSYARQQLADPKGLPLSIRLICEAHRRLMRGARGVNKAPGEIRRSQNWIGGSRPGNARYVPPPPEAVPKALGALEHWLHDNDPLPPLVKAGLAHVQFETIHPFLDGNGRIGRLLIALLIEHWGLLGQPLLYISVAFRRRQREYYDRLAAVRENGDWEGWTRFFLDCVREAADDGVQIAQAAQALLNDDRTRLINHENSTVTAMKLFELLSKHPIVTVPHVAKLLDSTAPTARSAIELLDRIQILRETSGKQRDRIYAYHAYLHILTNE